MSEPPLPTTKENGGNWVHRLAGIAGLASTGVTALIVVFRDVLAASWLSDLSAEHSAIIIGLVVLGTFFVAVLAIFAWLAQHSNPSISQRSLVFLALVVAILCAMLAVVWRVIPPAKPVQLSSLEQGIRAYQEGSYDEAMVKFNVAQRADSSSVEPLVWQARVNMQRSRWTMAEVLLSRSLKIDPTHDEAKIEILVIHLIESGLTTADGLSALIGPEVSYAADWITCAEENKLLSQSFLTLSEIYQKCPTTDDLFS